MPDPVDTSDAEQSLDAYSLLSKPTLSITDEEATKIIADLRQRRERFMATKKPDKPRAAAKAKADPLSKEAKAENTAALLASLKLDL